MKKVLILGGGGFIGMNIARRLADRGDCEITLADQRFGDRLEDLFPSGREREDLAIIEADFTNAASYDRLDDSYDDVYMMAAIVGVNRTLEHPEEVIRVNTALVHHTLKWLDKSKVGRIVFASSSENYAATSDLFDAVIPTPETVPLCIGDIKHPRWTYALTKMLGESAFLHSAPKAGYEASIVRYQNAFGPNMGFRHVIPHLVQRFYQHDANEPFAIYGAQQTRAFCFISDSVEGTIRAMETPEAAGEIYHVGNDEEISMETLTKAVGGIMKFTGTYFEAPTYPGSVERRCPDLTKCKQELGYHPRITWQEGLEATVKWYSDFFEAGKNPSDIGFMPPEKLKTI